MSEGFTVDKAVQQKDVVLIGLDGLSMEGLALIRPIKAVSPKIEIIIIKDLNYMDLSIEGMDIGVFDDFLIPLDIDSLTKHIREVARE